MEMKLHNCLKQEENPLPFWMRTEMKKKEEVPEDMVAKFKRNPDSFFPPAIPPGKPKHK